MFGVLVVSYVLLRRDFALEAGNGRSAEINRRRFSSSINVDRVIILVVYIYDGIITYIAAIIFMSRLSSGQPSAGAWV